MNLGLVIKKSVQGQLFGIAAKTPTSLTRVPGLASAPVCSSVFLMHTRGAVVLAPVIVPPPPTWRDQVESPTSARPVPTVEDIWRVNQQMGSCSLSLPFR